MKKVFLLIMMLFLTTSLLAQTYSLSFQNIKRLKDNKETIYNQSTTVNFYKDNITVSMNDSFFNYLIIKSSIEILKDEEGVDVLAMNAINQDDDIVTLFYIKEYNTFIINKEKSYSIILYN